MAPTLFDPVQIGGLPLSHRIAMAPLTRYRADFAHVHNHLAVEYYSQRASVAGTLLITEATFISPRASGYANAPGIYNAEQIKAWKEVTNAVHEKKSYIFCQLWALGRAAKPEIVRKEAGDRWFASSSATPMQAGGEAPRALEKDDIWGFVGDYAQAAKNAIEAGFDGVEIHGANGYLIDQFTQDVCNKRTDAWGGSVEKRSRFGLEVAKAVVEAVGKEKVGIRLSPFSTFQAMKIAKPEEQFGHFIKGLKELGLAYLHLVESRISGSADIEATEKVDFALDIWGKTSPVLLAGGFKPDSAKRAMEEYKDHDVLIVFGRYFISNPDLPFRLQNGIELEHYNRDTFYKAESADGYTDQPFSKEWEAQNQSRL
ncbi:NADPH2 dehydrogenase, partial [Lecanoromycetidae sp. Uapishka_2]